MPVPGCGERLGDDRQVIASDPHVAVGQYDPFVARRGQHVFEVGYLEIAASDARIDHQRDVAIGPVANQGARDRQGAVAGIAEPKHNLHRGIVLVGERAQVFGQAGLGAMQRLQHRNGPMVGARPARPAQRSSRKAPYREGGGGEIAPCNRQHRRETDSAHRRSIADARSAHAPCCSRCRPNETELAAPIGNASRSRPDHRSFFNPRLPRT